MAGSRSLRADARDIWEHGVRAVDAGGLVAGAVAVRKGALRIASDTFPLARVDRIAVVGMGKAGASMARALEAALGRVLESKRVEGVVCVPDRAVRPLERITLHGARAGHDNRPTAAGVAGTRRLLKLVGALGPRDLVICLVSGGGSALAPAPSRGVTLADKQRLTGLLESAGATINEMNAVRKHLSDLKGGGLVRATRARIVSLIVSDVVGDPLDVIASGPTAPDPTTFADALETLRRRGILSRAPRRALEHLWAGARGRVPETLKRPSRRVTYHVIGNNALALEAAARRARRLGYHVVNLGPALEGESKEVGVLLAGVARGVRDAGAPASAPACILSGGETTVTLGRHPGRGGRNQELVLGALVQCLENGLDGMAFLSGGTDGEDGPTDAAGAVADASVLRRAQAEGLDAREALAAHDAYPFFQRAGGLFRTRPTHTNVMDLRVVLVRPR